jgi:hypothetical protein
VASRAVGGAIAAALDRPASALARALAAEVRAQLGVALPAGLVLRHARLALRSPRGRDGEPLPGDVTTVAAVRGPRLSAAEPPAAAQEIAIDALASAG